MDIWRNNIQAFGVRLINGTPGILVTIYDPQQKFTLIVPKANFGIHLYKQTQQLRGSICKNQ